ncbi:rCG59598, isoform CRA_a [Rattus norvegicus]|uniref:RCG59598, isoform CRA_a n=1 Tax=Rattus norvegicus TaxID=10116 RepID=A6HQP9_RAT|nr:rCG59598, isoform CRA_a [Rattus norvegicus]
MLYSPSCATLHALLGVKLVMWCSPAETYTRASGHRELRTVRQ